MDNAEDKLHSLAISHIEKTHAVAESAAAAAAAAAQNTFDLESSAISQAQKEEIEARLIQIESALEKNKDL